jgi:ATP-dependent DNA helicase PIF1
MTDLVQLIICGDFLQLPPVSTKGQNTTFCFESKCWSNVLTEAIELKKVFRQSDAAFVKVLNEIRLGKVSEATLAHLQPCAKTVFDMSSGIEPTRLYPRKSEVEKENSKNLELLPGELHRFTAVDESKYL